MTTGVDDADYTALAQFRFELRKFLAFSERAAAAEELTGQQYQALQAIRGLSPPEGMTIGALAEILLLRHHSVVGLVDRLSAVGLVSRASDPGDKRRVIVLLTPKGAEKLRALSAVHAKELAGAASALMKALQKLGKETGKPTDPALCSSPAGPR